MRILHVAPYYEDAWAYGGIPRLVAAMARGLARRGHDVTVCTTDAADATSRARATSRRADGIDVRMFPNVSNRLAYHWQFYTPVGLAGFLRRAAAQFDVAHIHACHNLPGVMAAASLRRARVPYVVSPNGTAPRLERRRAAKFVFDALFAREFLPAAARVLAVTEAERDQLRQLGLDGASLRVLPNPVDVAEFDRPPDPARFRTAHGIAGGPTVLYLGKLTPRKGVDVLVRAFAHIETPDARLVIAGNDMGSGAAIADAIDDCAVGGRTTRVGLLRGAGRLDALAAASVVVYPSRDEVFGLVPVEALLCGRPVIVCSDSGCGEVIARVGGGHVVPFGDALSLAGAIDSILGNQPLWLARARAAGERVRREFAAEAVCGRLEELYREVLA